MGSSFDPPFPNTPGKKNSIESVWNKFSSPYDPPDTIDHHRTLSPEPRLLQHKRIARSFPPASSKMTRSTSLPRRTVSPPKSKRLNFQFLTPPHWLTSVKNHTTDDQDTFPAPGEIGNREEIMKRERRISRSAEILDDDFEFVGHTGKESKTRILHMNKSSEELETSETQCLVGLERTRVCGTSRSDESIHLKIYPKASTGISTCQVEGHADSLQKRRNKIDHNEVPRVIESSDYLHNPGILSGEINQHYYNDDPQKIKPEEEEDGMGHGKEAAVFVVSGNRDHPPITVRPGVSLDKFRSSRPQAGKFVASPESHAAHKRNRSTSCDLGDIEEMFPDCDDFCGKDRQEPKSKDTPDKSCRKKEYGTQFHDIPQMPELNLAKYNLGGSFRRRDMRRAFSAYQHTLLETYPQRLFAGSIACWPSCVTAESGKIIIDDDDVFTTSALKYPRGYWEPVNTSSTRRRLLRSSTSVRSRSEERRRSSLLRSLSVQQQDYRHSAEGRIPSKYQNPSVSLFLTVQYIATRD